MSSLRANFKDHKKNPSKFPILNEGLLVLIDSHFHALPAHDDYIHTSYKEDTSAGDLGDDESGSDFEDESHPPSKKVKLEKTMNTNPIGGKGKKGQKKIMVSSSSTSAVNDSTTSSGTKASPEDSMSEKKDSKELDNHNLQIPHSPPHDSGNVSVAIHEDLHPKCFELNDKKEDYENVLGVAWEHAIDTFNMFKWLFHELKEVRLNQRALGSKMEVIHVENDQINQMDVGQWMIEEKKLVLQCIKSIGQGVDQIKKRFEDHISNVEE